MNAGAITTIAEWLTKDGQLETVLNLLAEVAVKSTEEEGNLFYTAYQNHTDPNTLYLIEGYTDESALAKHRNSDHYKKIVVEKILPLLEARKIVQVSELNLNDLQQAE
ncbi:putative quinol monooxygenase [Spirosoma sp. KNUC1025]|uniref:putative quinol monooxygenase n=1 Tax=Spirosoma sp. KNUC1025 TaxID=2894082 RepID=UPI00386A6ADE|nr:antibiotic biosynthesis monooxygenase [Spirosoma sp. KNUC1025]